MQFDNIVTNKPHTMTDPPGEVQRVHCDGLLEVMEVAVVAPVVVEEVEEVEVEVEGDV